MKISNNGTKEISYDPAVMFTVTFITLTSSEMYWKENMFKIT